MPPATFIVAAAPSFSNDPGSGHVVMTFLTPAATKPGDALIILVPAASLALGGIDPAKLGAGWTVIGTTAAASGLALSIVRRVATDTEPPSHAVTVLDTPTTIAGALLVYRGLDNGAALIAVSAVDVGVNTSFPCPSRTLVAYSDLYLGIAFTSATGAAVFTAPAGTTERFNLTEVFTSTVQLQVFELLKESTGATGAQQTTAAASETGLAASLLLATLPAQLAPSITPDIPGAIGFVTVGV